jgi:Icc-related predicted phosphoesterase
MKILPNTKAKQIVELALDLMDKIRGSRALSIEVDNETGVQILGELGACGATPDMPRDLSEHYLYHQLTEMLEQE